MSTVVKAIVGTLIVMFVAGTLLFIGQTILAMYKGIYG